MRGLFDKLLTEKERILNASLSTLQFKCCSDKMLHNCFMFTCQFALLLNWISL